MGAGDGIPGVIKAIDDLGSHAVRTAEQLKILVDIANSARYSTEALDKEMVSAGENAKAFAVIFHSILDIQTAIADGYQQRAAYQGNQGVNDKAYTQKIESQFASIITQLQAVGGPNSALAGIAGNILKELQGGIITPDEALDVLRKMLSGYEGGILQDIGNAPTMTARNLAWALEAFIHGGNLA